MYAAGATGDAVPTVTIAGSHTGLDAPQGLALDPAGGLYVVNNPEPYRDPSITVYAAGATGDATPSGTIVGGDPRPSTFAGLARDAAGQLYVTCDGTHTGWGSCISVYAPQATGNAVPVATIQGVNTSLYSPRSIAVDRAGRTYALSSQDSRPSIAVFAPGARGNVRPAWVIGGNLAGLAGGYALALDAAARI